MKEKDRPQEDFPPETRVEEKQIELISGKNYVPALTNVELL